MLVQCRPSRVRQCAAEGRVVAPLLPAESLPLRSQCSALRLDCNVECTHRQHLCVSGVRQRHYEDKHVQCMRRSRRRLGRRLGHRVAQCSTRVVSSPLSWCGHTISKSIKRKSISISKMGGGGDVKSDPNCVEPACKSKVDMFRSFMGGGSSNSGAKAKQQAPASSSSAEPAAAAAPTDCPLGREELGNATWGLVGLHHLRLCE